MSTMHKCWSLYNRLEKLRVDDLTKDQVRTILLSVPTSRMGEWFACREGDIHWQPIREFPEFYEDASVLKGEFSSTSDDTGEPTVTSTSAKTKTHTKAAKKLEARRPMFEDASPDLFGTASTLKIESVPTKERRSARRYVRNLTFHAKTKGATFECATRDISMAGISLAKKLPMEFTKNFRAELRLNGDVIAIVASRVNSTSVKIKDAEAWDLLRQWIVSW